MIYKLKDKQLTLKGEGHFIAPNATIVGDVTLETKTSVWFNVVIRAENDSVVIGEGSNIQDGSVLHVDPGSPINIGKNVTVGHKAMIHGATIGDGSLIGINAVVLNGAKIGKGCLIGANALVPEGMEIPDGSMVLGSPAKSKKQLSLEMQELLLLGAASYVDNSALFNAEMEKDERFDG
jgi:carbonic anhydrase/acetyltransferase-like protein (isoleucine patch superfamily)